MRVGLESEDCGIISTSFLSHEHGAPKIQELYAGIFFHFGVTVDYETRHQQDLVNTQLA